MPEQKYKKSHYLFCEDKDNCNCENIKPCDECRGYGFIDVSSCVQGQFVNVDCPHCEGGFVEIKILE